MIPNESSLTFITLIWVLVMRIGIGYTTIIYCIDTILEKFNQVLISFINLSLTNVKHVRSKYTKIKQWITKGLII